MLQYLIDVYNNTTARRTHARACSREVCTGTSDLLSVTRIGRAVASTATAASLTSVVLNRSACCVRVEREWHLTLR